MATLFTGQLNQSCEVLHSYNPNPSATTEFIDWQIMFNALTGYPITNYNPYYKTGSLNCVVFL